MRYRRGIEVNNLLLKFGQTRAASPPTVGTWAAKRQMPAVMNVDWSYAGRPAIGTEQVAKSLFKVEENHVRYDL